MYLEDAPEGQTRYYKLKKLGTPDTLSTNQQDTPIDSETGGEITADQKVDTPKTDIWGKLRNITRI